LLNQKKPSGFHFFPQISNFDFCTENQPVFTVLQNRWGPSFHPICITQSLLPSCCVCSVLVLIHHILSRISLDSSHTKPELRIHYLSFLLTWMYHLAKHRYGKPFLLLKPSYSYSWTILVRHDWITLQEWWYLGIGFHYE
jgi:hypothetical protein